MQLLVKFNACPMVYPGPRVFSEDTAHKVDELEVPVQSSKRFEGSCLHIESTTSLTSANSSNTHLQEPSFCSTLTTVTTVAYVLHELCLLIVLTCMSKAYSARGGSRGGASGAGAPPFCFFTALFSSLLTCCRYVATPDLASSARVAAVA